METLPPYWKVKASPIVRKFMEAHCPGENLDEYDLFAKDRSFYSSGYNAGRIAINHFDDLPEITQAQFKRLVYLPWKAGQGEATTTANVHKRPKKNGIELLKGIQGIDKPTRKRVELKYHLEMKEALQGEVESLQAEMEQYRAALYEQRVIIDRLINERTHRDEIITKLTDRLESLKQYNDNLIKLNEGLSDKLTTAESTIEKLHKSHIAELNEITKDRDIFAYMALGFGLCAALLAVANIVGW